RQHCVGAGFDAARDAPREMNSEERESRIGDRVNQVPNQLPSRWENFVVLTTKRNNSKRRLLTGQSHDTVAMKTGAIDHAGGPDSALSRFENNLVTPSADSAHFAARQNPRSSLLNQFRVFPGDSAVVGNTGAGHDHRRDTSAVGLDFTQLLQTDHR